MNLQDALSIADGLVESLGPHCEIINLAGSCRREKPEVKDIELVVAPKSRIIKDVFGEGMNNGRSKEFINKAELLGDILKGSPADGKYVQIKLSPGVNLDLFIPLAHDYYRQFAVRTCSGDYAMRKLAGSWVKNGWCGCGEDGLRRITDCLKTTGKNPVWKCVNKNGERPPAWKSEQDFFDWLGLRWIEPSLRNI